jgi:hypothetical protein
MTSMPRQPPTSSVYRNAEGLKWYEVSFLVSLVCGRIEPPSIGKVQIPHEPIRRDMGIIAEAMEKGSFDPIARPWQLQNFYR